MICCSSICYGAVEISRSDAGNTLLQEQKITFVSLIQDSPSNLQSVLKDGMSSLHDSSNKIDELYFKPLGGGFSSSKLFLFSVADNEYVLRVLDPKSLNDPNPTRSKRLREVLAHKTASVLGIAPEVVYADPDGLILIMRYIYSHTLTKLDLDNKKFLLNLGASLRCLHQTKIVLPESRTQLDRVKKHYTRAQNKGIAFPSNFESLYEEYFKEGGSLFGEDVLCHGDLNPANILVQNKKVFFIDWAGATYDNRFTDLGYLSLLSGMNSQQLLVFLKGYFGREPTTEELENVELAQARTCFLTAVVWFDFSESEEEICKPMLGRVNRLDQMLASPKLKTGFEYVLEGSVVDPSSAPATEIQKFALGFLKEYLIRMKRLEEK